MISKVYNSDYNLFRLGSRKGKTRDEIEGKELYLQKHVRSKLSMPFGKYKGRYMHNLPINYIKWFLKNVRPTKYNKYIFREIYRITSMQTHKAKNVYYREIPSVEYNQWKEKYGIKPKKKRKKKKLYK
jgi:hypothetical protein